MPIRNRNKKGGSKASDLVMSTNPVLCDEPASPVIQGKPIEANIKDLSLYSSTGGRRVLKKNRGKNYSCNAPTNCGQAHPGAFTNCLGGGSSDWRSTVYSRGPVNTPSMPQEQFRAFTETADYMPNESLRSLKFMKGGKQRRSQQQRRSSNKRRSGSKRRSQQHRRSGNKRRSQQHRRSGNKRRSQQQRRKRHNSKNNRN